MALLVFAANAIRATAIVKMNRRKTMSRRKTTTPTKKNTAAASVSQ